MITLAFSDLSRLQHSQLNLRMLVLQVMVVSREAMVVGMTRVAKEGMEGASKVSFLTACVLRMT